MSCLLIKNARAVFEDSIRDADILLKDGLIDNVDFSGDLPPECEIIDVHHDYVSPGFIDIHVHGGGGYDFMDCTPEALREISRIHLLNGTTTLLPTAVSSEFDSILKLIQTYKGSISDCPNFCGIHLEGPYISKNQKGAHKEHLLHAPNEYETELLLSEGKGIIKRITAAPELEHMKEFTQRMLDIGVVMSIGHSDATSDVASEAFSYGFSHVTHLYSATPSVRKIDQVVKAGVVEAAYLNDDVSVELIADGKHAAVDALKLAVKIKGADKVALVSDALRPAGTSVKESYLGEIKEENRVIIEDGVAKLPDRSSFAGSIATTKMLLERAVNHYGFSVHDAVYMLTASPADVLRLRNKGRLSKGAVADIVSFDTEFRIKYVILNDRLVKKEG